MWQFTFHHKTLPLDKDEDLFQIVLIHTHKQT
jgi:hypothetical protein